MNNIINDDIERYIGNRFYEHGHPFKYGSAGMEEFSKLTVILKKMKNDELLKYISSIEQISGALNGCVACCAKLTAFLIIICEERFPERCADYEMVYQRCSNLYSDRYSRQPGKNRDFKKEVNEALSKWGL